jgi:hypothetical protein
MEYRYGAASSAVASVPGTASSTEDTLGIEASGTHDTLELPLATEVDWNDATQQKRFAALERKVGRGAASEDERQEYLSFRESRRGWIGSHHYLENYIQEQREKAILQKLAELQEILTPKSKPEWPRA